MGAAAKRVFRLKPLRRMALWFLLLIGIYYLLAAVINREPEVVYACQGILEDKIETTILWIRDEKVYRAPINGVYHASVQEGEKVAKDAEIGQIKVKTGAGQQSGDDEILTFILRKRDEVKAKRKRLAGAFQQKKLSLMLEMTNLEKSSPKNRADELRIKKQLSVLKSRLEQEEKIYRENCLELEKNLALLDKEEEKYYQAGRKSFYIFRAADHGLISYNLDGMEEEFNIKKVNADSIHWLRKNFQIKTVKNGQEVSENDPVYKIISNDSLYGMAVLPGSILEKIHENQRIFFNYAGEPWYARVIMKYAGQNNQNGFIVFSCASFPDFACLRRKQRVEMVFSRYSGIIVPLRAITENSGEIGVYVSTIRGRKFMPVEVTGTVGSYSAIKGIPEGKRVIIR